MLGQRASGTALAPHADTAMRHASAAPTYGAHPYASYPSILTTTPYRRVCVTPSPRGTPRHPSLSPDPVPTTHPPAQDTATILAREKQRLEEEAERQAAACTRLEAVAAEVDTVRALPAAASLEQLAEAYGGIRQRYREEYIMYGLAQAALAQALPRMQVWCAWCGVCGCSCGA